eukprot:12902334-Alexandrium_andersonii.AAC.1
MAPKLPQPLATSRGQLKPTWSLPDGFNPKMAIRETKCPGTVRVRPSPTLRAVHLRTALSTSPT